MDMDGSSMDIVLCSGHNAPCFLKTGTKPGPNYKRSFFMCSSLVNSCGFVQQSTKLKARNCPIHEEIIGVQKWDTKNPQKVSFFCAKREGRECGTFTVSTKEGERKENKAPLPLKGQRSRKSAEKDTNTEAVSTQNDTEPSSVQLGGDMSYLDVTHLDRSSENSYSGRDTSDCSSRKIETMDDDSEGDESLTDGEENVEDNSVSFCEEAVSVDNSLNDTSSLTSDTTSFQSSHNTDMSPFQSSHNTDMSPFQSSHKADMSPFQSSHKADMSPFQSSHKADMSPFQSSHNTDMSPSQSSHKDHTSTFQASHKTDMSPFQSSHKADMSPFQSSHKADMSPFQSSHNTDVSPSQSSHKDHTSTFQASHKADMSPFQSSDKTDLPNTHTSPFHSSPKIGTSPFHLSRQDMNESAANERSSPSDSISRGRYDKSLNVSSRQSPIDHNTSSSDCRYSPKNSSFVDLSDSDDQKSGVSVASGQRSLYPPSEHSSSAVQEVQSAVKGSQCASEPSTSTVGDDEKQFKVGYQTKKVLRQYFEIQHMLQTQSAHLPDGGAALRVQQKQVSERLRELKVTTPKVLSQEETAKIISQRNITAQSKTLTVGVVKHLHSSLVNCPTENTLTENPPGLTVDLMEHQKRALTWLMWRETQTPAAGILADDMGLGKTLSMLSLIVQNRLGLTSEEIREWKKQPPAKSELVKSLATLVVCPASLLMQWQAEAESKFEPGSISVLVYHGASRTTDPQDLTRYDLVITTYNIVGTEEASCESGEPIPDAPKRKRKTGSHSTLFKVHWRRVILDEAHNIKNPKTAMSIGCCKLHTDYRWAVTGTPIQNALKDFYSLMKFIHLAPFDDYNVWRDTVERKGTRGMERLNTMVASLVLRRTKEELSGGILKLTQKVETRHSIKLKPEEMAVYSHIYNEARKVMFSWLQDQGENVGVDPITQPQAQDEPDLPDQFAPIVSRIMRSVSSTTGKGTCVLLMLLRLRQCCNHLQLLVNSTEDSNAARDDIDLGVQMAALSLDSAEGSIAADRTEVPTIFTRERQSTKVASVILEIRRIVQVPDDPPMKCVVVSQWTKMLDIVAYQLDIVGLPYTRIDGSVAPAERLNRVKQLNSPRRIPSVMLLSLQAGGVGLNLVGANHIFLLDMHWNPALEQQAADRCHRIGQMRDVYIHKFVCEGTVEERILRLQERKLQLASNVLAGASQKSRSNKLTLNDLKDLFELH